MNGDAQNELQVSPLIFTNDACQITAAYLKSWLLYLTMYHRWMNKQKIVSCNMFIDCNMYPQIVIVSRIVPRLMTFFRKVNFANEPS